MPLYKKKPVTIEARQFNTPNEGQNIAAWVRSYHGDDSAFWFPHNVIVIHTLEGAMTAKPGWWVIKGVEGEFYPCDPDIFDKTYELVRKENDDER